MDQGDKDVHKVRYTLFSKKEIYVLYVLNVEHLISKYFIMET